MIVVITIKHHNNSNVKLVRDFLNEKSGTKRGMKKQKTILGHYGVVKMKIICYNTLVK